MLQLKKSNATPAYHKVSGFRQMLELGSKFNQSKKLDDKTMNHLKIIRTIALEKHNHIHIIDVAAPYFTSMAC